MVHYELQISKYSVQGCLLKEHPGPSIQDEICISLGRIYESGLKDLILSYICYSFQKLKKKDRVNNLPLLDYKITWFCT